MRCFSGEHLCYIRLRPLLLPISPINEALIIGQPAKANVDDNNPAVSCALVSSCKRNSTCVPAKGFKSFTREFCSPISIGRFAFAGQSRFWLRRVSAVASCVLVWLSCISSCFAANSFFEADAIASPAICVVESSFAVNLLFSRPVMSSILKWDICPNTNPAISIQNPKSPISCTPFLALSCLTVLSPHGSMAICLFLWNRLEKNSAPSNTTPIIIAHSAMEYINDQNFSDSESITLIEKVGHGALDCAF